MELALLVEARALAIAKPFNRHLVIHAQKISLDQDTIHAFITAFFHHAGDWIRENCGQPICYLWVIENPPFIDGKGGLHFHALLHIPDELWDRFKILQRRWLRLSGGKPKSGGLVSTPLEFYGEDPADYLDHGLFGVTRYIFKGLHPDLCPSYGIDHDPQGWVSGKRFGYAEVLSPSRADLAPISSPQNPRFKLSSRESRARRMMNYFRKIDDEPGS
jgi:hypothetical protein